MTENEVTAACIGWLRKRGWICRRQHVGSFQPLSGGAIVRMGEEGECDWRCLRARGGAYIEYFELEMKATGKSPRPKQREYIAKRIHQGFNATWVDSLEALKKWYAGVGYAAS
jgi:hypothetical protein